MEEAGRKKFPLSSLPPTDMFPSLVPSKGRTREQHNSHMGGIREQRNSYKWQNVETKRRPTTTKQTPHSGDQTLKLRHVRTPTLSKRRGRLGAEYNIDHRRKEIIYRET